MSSDNPRRLGRGLGAIIATSKQQRDTIAPSSGHTRASIADLQKVRISDVNPNRFQPRRNFTEPELAELQASIHANGLLQPIVVRSNAGGGWELVAGERRLRAATRLGWAEIPAVVRDFDDRAMLTLALVENLQRADLNPLEEAEGYQRLIDEFGLTQQQVADAVGKDRTTITNLLRVLTLPLHVRQLVERGEITAGHARALLPIKDERKLLALANEIVARQLSVRDTEARARVLAGEATSKPRAAAQRPSLATAASNPDSNVKRVEQLLRTRLQTDVQVQVAGNDSGVIRISFYSADDLERVMDLVVGRERSDFD
ncbi:MAG: ParB/RepB/Spo0J family partition protein [Gemmatimonadaceae bacterium]